MRRSARIGSSSDKQAVAAVTRFKFVRDFRCTIQAVSYTHLMAQAYEYVFICITGIFFICEYNAFSALLRGYGDSISPLLFVAAACVCNIAGDLFTVGVLHMGVAGTAISTVVSQLSLIHICFCITSVYIQPASI